MDIVYLAHFSGSPHHGMVYGHYYLAREWVRAGHQVTIIAASFSHVRFRQPSMGPCLTEECIDGIRYLWVPTPSYVPADQVGRVRNILTFVARTWSSRLPIDRADLVICSSHHPFAFHCAERLSRRLGAKRLVFEVRDLWPLTLIEISGATQWNPFIRAMQWSEDYAYRHADKVVSVLAGARDYMVDHGMSPDKFCYVPNGVDVDDAQLNETLPAEHAAVLACARARYGFIVGYAGKVGTSNALHTLIDGVALSANPDIAVAILGDGSHVPALKAHAESRGLSERAFFLVSVRKAQVGDFLGHMDAVFIGLQNQRVFRFGVSPTKLNDYMLAAKPVISAIDAPGDPVAESGGGVSCRAENPEDVAEALNALYAIDPEQRAEMGTRGRQWILEHRDYRVLAARFLAAVFDTSGGEAGRTS